MDQVALAYNVPSVACYLKTVDLCLANFRECGFYPRQHWGLSKLRKNSPCLGKMLNREGVLLFNLVEQAQYHISPAHPAPLGIKRRILQYTCHQGANNYSFAAHWMNGDEDPRRSGQE